ncbi:MAG: nitrite reductase large subunit NirB [Myxococcota bacterium]|nr:nitrite reductase large subunit NirB [Myxococcota bacterium]
MSKCVPGSNSRFPRVLVIGNGMVGQKFLETLSELGGGDCFEIVVFGEESRPAYDRVHLSEYFSDKSASELELSSVEWAQERNIALRLSTKVTQIHREQKTVTLEDGQSLSYDYLVLATGSSPFLPPIPGIETEGVFVYRTLDDLDAIQAYGTTSKSAIVMGGGLLGLEAANAMKNLNLDTTVIEYAPSLMPRQLDLDGGLILKKVIEELNIPVLLNKQTTKISQDANGLSLDFNGDASISTDMLIVSAGIRPRDELAHGAGLTIGERGGVVVDDTMRTSDPSIFAIGEVASFQGQTYGLVAPGYNMAQVAASILMAQPARFPTPDLSTKLKLLGVDVATFGQLFTDEESSQIVKYTDPGRGIYKRLNLSLDGKQLIGGMLVGEASAYQNLLQIMKNSLPLPEFPETLLLPSGASTESQELELPDSAQVCSCENISKGAIRTCMGKGQVTTLVQLKAETKAGTGCGGCAPLLTKIFRDELAAQGKTLVNHVCEHFTYSRKELFSLIKIRGYRTFKDTVEGIGVGYGCETCKPTVASILASLWNEPAFEHDIIQDTNDRFMANIQRGGTYSVVPRIPGGEITPDKLIVLGEVAKKYNLYSKITGGQRIDLFGAHVHQLPDIWEELIAAGFESGHAYAKSLRTIKSCVGTSWCRFGVGDSTRLAIKLENRYRGLRAPHKLKSAVSGCTRECAEAQSKDFGIIATEHGWNLYVGGNGGTTPRHAQLLATDLDEKTLVSFIDRFLMYYIHTADKLQRTARWIEELDGGIDRLREIIVGDIMGIGEQLESEMEALVGRYQCEWKALVNDSQRRTHFSHFSNSSKVDPNLEFVQIRRQKQPIAWTKSIVTQSAARNKKEASPSQGAWFKAGSINELNTKGGSCVKVGNMQIALYHLPEKQTWFATQNMCPHRRDMVLSRGLTGYAGDTPKVACPQHKKTFSLLTGKGLNDPSLNIETYPVEIRDQDIYVFLSNKVVKSFDDSKNRHTVARACEVV